MYLTYHRPPADRQQDQPSAQGHADGNGHEAHAQDEKTGPEEANTGGAPPPVVHLGGTDPDSIADTGGSAEPMRRCLLYLPVVVAVFAFVLPVVGNKVSAHPLIHGTEFNEVKSIWSWPVEKNEAHAIVLPMNRGVERPALQAHEVLMGADGVKGLLRNLFLRFSAKSGSVIDLNPSLLPLGFIGREAWVRRWLHIPESYATVHFENMRRGPANVQQAERSLCRSSNHQRVQLERFADNPTPLTFLVRNHAIASRLSGFFGSIGRLTRSGVCGLQCAELHDRNYDPTNGDNHGRPSSGITDGEIPWIIPVGLTIMILALVYALFSPIAKPEPEGTKQDQDYGRPVVPRSHSAKLSEQGPRSERRKDVGLGFYITSYPVGDKTYGSHIYAPSFEDAKRIAALRGLGEAVDGITEPYTDEPADLRSKIHQACFLGYVALKAGTITAEELLGDKGILHEAIHLMCGDPDANPEAIEEGLARLRTKVPGYVPV